jgi:hypothetical protein
MSGIHLKLLNYSGKLIMLEVFIVLSVVGQLAVIYFLHNPRTSAQRKADLIEKESQK